MNANSHFYKVLVESFQASIKDLIISNAFSMFSCSGVEEFSLEESEVDEILGERSYSGGVLPSEIYQEVQESVEGRFGLTFYFSENNAGIQAKKFLDYIQQNYSDCHCQLTKEVNQDWNENWRESFGPIVISGGFAVIPSWREDLLENYPQGVLLYPGQGFGTGEHATTHMCLEILHKNIKVFSKLKLRSCLDYGTGSGILGIAYAYFTPGEELYLFDIDKDALENTRQNIELNKNRINLSTARVGDQKPQGQVYGVVFANILLGTLKDCAQNIAQSVAGDGHLIVSGLLIDQMNELEKVYRKLGFLKEAELTKGDWGAIHFIKGNE